MRIIDLQVLDLPMSDYLKFGIEMGSSIAEQYGQRFLFVERDKVANLIARFQDYWLFDNKAVIPMNYDPRGRFINKGTAITEPISLSKYIYLKTDLIKRGIPMHEFLKNHKIDRL